LGISDTIGKFEDRGMRAPEAETESGSFENPLCTVSSRDRGEGKINTLNEIKAFHALTVVRFPKVNESPIEPYLHLIHGIVFQPRMEMCRCRAGKDHRVRTDRFESFIFSEARHTPNQGINTQAIEYRVYCISDRSSAQGMGQ
jgi:hypothetical protein